MPDPTHKTVSASSIAALWNKSPYQTRWMLYHQHRGKVPADKPHGRMTMGKRMEPLLLDLCREDLRLEIEEDQDYVRRGPLGCTRDNIANDPQRGPGTVETKCCFDYKVWMQRWGGGEELPEDILLQVHTQMYVGDGTTPFEWGQLAVWVCGEMKYFPIEPSEKLWATMEEAAQMFLDQVAKEQEPDPFGMAMEIPVFKLLYPPPDPDVILDKLDDFELGEAARMFDWLKGQEKGAKRAMDQIKTQLLAAARYDGDKIAKGVNAPGAFINIRSNKAGALWPEVKRTADPEARPDAGGEELMA